MSKLRSKAAPVPRALGKKAFSVADLSGIQRSLQHWPLVLKPIAMAIHDTEDHRLIASSRGFLPKACDDCFPFTHKILPESLGVQVLGRTFRSPATGFDEDFGF
jgi:hypothetical protein